MMESRVVDEVMTVKTCKRCRDVWNPGDFAL